VEGDLDTSPPELFENSRKSYKGSQLIGYGFCFDDVGASKGMCEPVERIEQIVSRNPASESRIKTFITGEDVNSDPRQVSERFVFDLGDLTEAEANLLHPELMEIAQQYVFPVRKNDNRDSYKRNWWKFGERTPGLYNAISGKDQVLCTLFTSSHLCFSILPSKSIFANAIIVTTLEGLAPFSVLQSRSHELWARFFSSTLEDRLRYAPSDCFRTFPFPANYETDPALEAVGEAYHSLRAQLMIARNEGLTKTYNRFHGRGDNAADIARLRALHHEMDVAVLRAYARGASSEDDARGWNDLADRAAPEFIEQDADEGKTPKTRLDWPSDFKDEVLARLLALNATRAAEERAAGLIAVDDGEDDADPDSEDDTA
jgi:hypothetical protein